MEINTAGMELVEKHYQEYGSRARELKKQGKQLIGYSCALVPLEIITAAGLIPFRIIGNVRETISRANVAMETIVCSMVCSGFDLALKGKYEFLDGLVIPHACDSIARTYDIWKYSLDLSYSHFINMPHSADDSSLEFYKDILNTFRKSLGTFFGKEISDTKLEQAIELHNKNRAMMRELTGLRKLEPPLISGEELSKVMITIMSIPVEESITLLDSIIPEVKQRARTASTKSPRIMVVGPQIDDTAFIKLIEDSGAHVVVDDLCLGTREYWNDIDTGGDPVYNTAERYLRKVKCARTIREQEETYQHTLEERFGHIRDFIRDYEVDGVIIYIYKYCDPFGFEVPAVKSYVESLGTPVLYLESEHSMSAIAQLRTRIQAFLEMLGWM